MRVSERPEFTVREYARQVKERGKGTFQSKALRDEVQMLIGGRKSSISGSNLHPEYITDYVGTLEQGFGNTQYQMYWSKLYTIELRPMHF